MFPRSFLEKAPNIFAFANSVNSGIASSAHTQSGNVLFTCTLSRMSLATCSRFFRPCLSRIRPVLSPPRLNECRLFSSLQKRPNFVASRLPARHASGGSKDFGALLSENGLLVLGFGLLGGSLAYVSITLKIFANVKISHFDTIESLSSPTLSLSDVSLRLPNQPWGRGVHDVLMQCTC